ncbi:hypothetical protein PVAND_012084 [Polypedilum vanderplanki]|uniref:NADP-dependent oxidoreductase domain-containing protein n=1 Tax=Polypedilum vanderplanki TaxID=319348 RepID=A0A9J6CLN3_POLVA|nr:hypothetical protein PVAND_012084 [Polypedilum vanderplanki]
MMCEVFTLNTGHKIPMIGLGTYLIQGTDQTLKVIDEALKAGYRLFDTAHMYNNERYLGNAFKTLLPKHNLRREDIFITTKFVPSTSYKNEEDYLALVQESLTNLQTSYLDMIAWKALSKFKEQGLIRSIGVSNFLIRHLEELKKECEVVPALNQVEYHPKCYDFELLQYCKDNGILMQAYSSLGTSSNRSLRNDKTVVNISKNYSKSASQILLKWALKRNVGIIPKASSKNHLEQNMDMNFDIFEDDMKILDSMRGSYDERLDWDPNSVI